MSDKPTTIILVRHGETDWNREGRYQGKRDIPLNDRGREQAAQLATALSGMAFDAAWSSQLSRAADTAKAVLAGGGPQLQLDPGLAEIDHGEWEGLLADEVAGRWPGLLKAWREAPETVDMPGGENLAAVQSRAVAAIERIVAAHSGGLVLVAAHDAVNRALLCWAVQAPLSSFSRFKQASTALNALEFNSGTPKVVFANSTAHTGSLLPNIVHKAL